MSLQGGPIQIIKFRNLNSPKKNNFFGCEKFYICRQLINRKQNSNSQSFMASKKLNTIFIVEDNAMERSMLKDHLAKYPGVKVKEYSNGNACIKDMTIGNVEEPDLILMDYFLDSTFGASKDGMESLTKIKEISPDTNIIMLTSVDNQKIVDLAKKKGALDYVVKSSTGFNELDAALQKHFGLKK